MEWNYRRVIQSLAYFGFYFLTIGALSPTVVAVISVIIAVLNIIVNPRDILSNYILLFTASIFYNAFEGEIFWREFNRGESSVAFAVSANWLGLLFVIQLFISGQISWSRFQWQKLDSLLAMLLIMIVISSVVGRDLDNSLKELQRYPSFIGFYVITRLTISNLKRVWEMISVFYASIVIVFFITLQKVFIGSQYGALVDFIFLLTPVIHLSLLNRGSFKFMEIVNIIFLTIGSLSLLISDSRRVLMSIGLIWISAFNTKRLLVLSIVVLIPVFLILQTVELGVKFRYEQTADQLGDLLSSEEGESNEVMRQLTTGRSLLWQAGLAMIIDNPLFGVGLENHVALMPEYGGYTEIRVHNAFLDLTAQIGLIGLVIFIFILFDQLGRMKRLKRYLEYDHHYKNAGTLIYALYISYLAVILFSFFGGSMLLGKWGWFQVGFITSVLVAVQKELDLSIKNGKL